jgi:hypothetical protein
LMIIFGRLKPRFRIKMIVCWSIVNLFRFTLKFISDCRFWRIYFFQTIEVIVTMAWALR